MQSGTNRRLTPLRVLFGLYAFDFVLAGIAAFIGNVGFARATWCALGILLAVYGLGLLTNVGGMASEAAAMSTKSRWAPPVFGEPWFPRVIGPFFLLAGLLFAWQALSMDASDL